MKRTLLTLLSLLALVLAIDLLAQGPLTNLGNLKVRTDASGYLITTAAAYTAPDGPLTAFGNLKGRTDSNGYLLTTFNGAQTLTTVSYTPILFAALGSAAVAGQMKFCSDCTVTTAATCPGTQASCVCAGSGTGAFARSVNSAWYCTP